ncbi:MAG: YceI family protein [Myxococcota bacterium]
MKLIASLVAALSLTVVSSACGKKTPPPTPATETKAPETKAPETKAPEADAAAPAPEADAAPAAADDAAPAAADDAVAPVAAEDAGEATETKPYLKVTVAHDHDKPPVTSEFTNFKVTEAHIDLTKPETAKAVIEVDLTSFSSGIPDRDAHVKSPDFLDVTKFTTATITVAGVKPQAATPDAYDATATLDLHGIKKDVPVTFKVVEKKADGSIVIEGEAKAVARADFGMTKAPAEVNVGPTFDVALRLDLAELAAAVPPAAGSAADLMGKMLAMQSALIDIVEANKTNPDAAAEAIEKYAAEHKDEIKALKDAQAKLSPADMEAAMNGMQDKFKALGERGMKLSTENPELNKSERLKKAMESFGKD